MSLAKTGTDRQLSGFAQARSRESVNQDVERAVQAGRDWVQKAAQSRPKRGSKGIVRSSLFSDDRGDWARQSWLKH